MTHSYFSFCANRNDTVRTITVFTFLSFVVSLNYYNLKEFHLGPIKSILDHRPSLLLSLTVSKYWLCPSHSSQSNCRRVRNDALHRFFQTNTSFPCLLYVIYYLFRPGGYRTPSRTSGPLKAGNVCRHVRPVLREAALHRRSSAAQTDVCALPNRWSSDGYLAHKVSYNRRHK